MGRDVAGGPRHPRGEDGARLSGGQRQRLVVARALLADAPVLVLDEPTAQLDPDTAEALVTDVLAAVDGRSVLLVTHRPEGLDLVDEVVSLPAR
jgi:ATP-binding cassette subfamily C protein CydCD